METGILANAFKTSKAIPIYKNGDQANLNNYRPISMLPTISKLFERVIHMQLYAYLCENNLLCKHPYGFRSKHFTELATIKLLDYLLKQMDDNQRVQLGPRYEGQLNPMAEPIPHEVRPLVRTHVYHPYHAADRQAETDS